MISLISSIPSPSSAKISIGPLNFTAYGVMVACGVIAAGVLAGRRMERRGVGTRNDLSFIATRGAVEADEPLADFMVEPIPPSAE